MENSDTFDFEKFVVFFESIYRKMPPFGKPRAFIKNFKPKTLLPYEMNELKKKHTTLPSIRIQNPKSNWRANIRIAELDDDDDQDNVHIKDFMITKQGEVN